MEHDTLKEEAYTLVYEKRSKAEYYRSIAQMHVKKETDQAQDMLDKYKEHQFPHHEQAKEDQMEQAMRKLEEEAGKRMVIAPDQRGMRNGGS